ncbi:MAG: vitamin K epoxide reductase family protein [Patescibacteria group bacterium]
MTDLALIFTLSAIGISETAYLIKKRKALEQPICVLGENCATVLESRYNRLLLIHNDVLGFLFYLAVSLVAGFLVIEMKPIWFWGLILKAMIVSGSLMSVIFTYLQAKVIKSWCFWCLMSAFTIWLMLVIIIG